MDRHPPPTLDPRQGSPSTPPAALAVVATCDPCASQGNAAPACVHADRLAAAARGDRPALHALARSHMVAMRGAAFSVLGNRGGEASDAAQDAWCRVLARPAALASVRPGTERTWLCSIARQEALNRLRRRQVRDRRGVNDPDAVAERTAAVPEQPLNDPAEIHAVQAVLDQMPTEQRELLTMALVQGMSTRAISEATGVPQSTVKSRLVVARRVLVARATRARKAAGE